MTAISFIGPWITVHAPNGSDVSTSRTIETVEIYEADYYGTGPKTYAKGYKRIQTTEGGDIHTGPRFGTWEDGHPDRIAALTAKIS